MTLDNHEKPDWFQMTEGDEIPRQRSIKRGVRALAVALPLLVLGTGFVIAQNQSSPGVSADASASLAPTQPTPTQTLSSTENSTAPVSGGSQSLSSTSSPSSLIKLPTGGGDDGLEANDD